VSLSIKFNREEHSLSENRRNYDSLEELNVDPVEKKLAQYKQK
jgi:hypothetical protein